VSVAPVVEERRVRWTTYTNLDAWFTNFRAFLLKFELACEGTEGGLIFDNVTMHCIINTNEMEISLDGSKTKAGGRPAVLFYDPHLPIISRSVTKLSLSCTEIFESNAARECMPPHWKFSTSGTVEEREKIQFSFLTHVQNTHRQFGYKEEKIWLATTGMNKKGGGDRC
jgi:hypothetical protein